MKNLFVSLSILFSCGFLWSASPVPYSGKVAISGVNYHGEANFTFSLHDGNGTTAWQNGQTPDSTIQVRVHNGRYSVLLGGQGMNALPPQLFLDYEELYLKVHFDNGTVSFVTSLLIKDHRHAPAWLEVAKTAKTADNAKSADSATIAETANSVKAGAVTPQMLQPSSITTAQLNEQILKYLKPEITLARRHQV